MKNQVNIKLVDTDSKLNVLLDEAAKRKDHVVWTKLLGLFHNIREVVVTFHEVWFQKIRGIHVCVSTAINFGITSGNVLIR